MQLFCPDCQSAFVGVPHCPKCGGRLLAPQEAFLNAAAVTPPPERWQPTLASRIILGLVVSFGLLSAFRDFTFATLSEASTASILTMLLRVLAVFGGGLMAAAGREKGSQVGLLVGIVTSGLLTAHAVTTNHGDEAFWWPFVWAFAYPVAAWIGGWIGGHTWPDAPQLPDMVRRSSGNSRRGLFAKLTHDKPRSTDRPTIWLRILIGALLGFIGYVGSEEIRHVLGKAPNNLFSVRGSSRAAPVGAQLGVLFTMLGGVIAAASTGAGLRHGLFAGVLAFGAIVGVSGGQVQELPSLLGLFLFFDVAPGPMTDGPTLGLIAGAIIGGFVICGWVGGQLFPHSAQPHNDEIRDYQLGKPRSKTIWEIPDTPRRTQFEQLVTEHMYAPFDSRLGTASSSAGDRADDLRLIVRKCKRLREESGSALAGVPDAIDRRRTNRSLT